MRTELLSWPAGVRVDRVLVLSPGEHAWNAARVSRHGRALRVEPLDRIRRGPDGAGPLPEAVAAEAARTGTWVVLGLPAQEAVARRLDTPFADAAKARQVLPSLLDGHLPFALEKCLHTFVDFQRNAAGHQSALAIAARREEVERQLDSTAGLTPAVVDAEGLALWRQALREHPPANREAPRVVAHAGGNHLTLVLGHGAHFHDALTFLSEGADAGAGDDERADLVRRVQRRWRALPPSWQESPATWIWCGPGATTGAVESVGEALATRGSTRVVADQPSTFLERALAAPLLLDGVPALNLLPAARIPEALRLTRIRRQRALALGWIASALIPLAAAVAWKTVVASRAAGFRAAALRSHEVIAGAPCPQPELVQVLAPRELETLRQRTAPFASLAAAPRSATLRAVLRGAHEQGVAADKLEWTGTSLVLQGPAQAPNDAAALAERLRQAGLVAQPESVPAGRWAVKVEVTP